MKRWRAYQRAVSCSGLPAGSRSPASSVFKRVPVALREAMVDACHCHAEGFMDGPVASAQTSGGETALFAAAMPVVILQVLLLLRCAHAQWAHCHRFLDVWLQRCASTHEGSMGTDCESALKSCVTKGLQERGQRNTQNAIRVLAPCMSGCLAIILYNLGARLFRPLSSGQTWLVIGFGAVLTVAFACPSRVSAQMPGLLYSGVMLFSCTFILTARPIPVYVFMSEVFSLLLRLTLSIWVTSVGQVAGWSLLYSLLGTYAFWQALGDGFVRMVLSYQLWSVATVVGLSFAATKATEADARREVEASVLRSESSGLWTLLDIVCDVVVPLGEDLKILGKASRFAAMVTLQAGSVEGMRLQDFMPLEEDQEAFEKCTRVHPEDSSHLAGALPRALHVKLRDSLGNVIRAELFCVTCQSPVERRFFVGIREFSDHIDHMPIPECRGPSAGRHPHRRGPLSSEASDGDSDSDRAPRPRPAPQAREWGPTSETGVELALVRLMRLCSLPAAPAQCCPFHRRVRHFQARLEGIGGIDCAPSFQLLGVAQCSKCGLLSRDRPEGDQARHAVAAAPQRCFACEAEIAPAMRLAHPFPRVRASL